MIPKPDHCLPCPLYGSGHGFSHLEGTGALRLLVAAEALGEHEEDEGLPLRPYAAAGAVFQRTLRELGIKRNDLLITNIIRCRPPGNELRGADYERAATDRCRSYFDAAVAEYRPHAILALGDTPMRELTDFQGVLTYRGFILPSRYGIPVVATYHPALLARGALGTLYGVFRRDVKLALDIAQKGVPQQLATHYELNPAPGRVREFLDHLRANPLLPITYDVETAGILPEAERAGRPTNAIIQIQFSCRPGQAIVLPWEGEYITLARAILATTNPKWGWNSRGFDDGLLERNEVVIWGERHDLMNAWLHLNPDFAGQRDGGSIGGGGDAKDFTARLMNLQSCLSFYAPEVGPWKHKATADLQFYGACDADYTYRCGEGIFNSLRRQGLYDGYYTHKIQLRKVLDDMGKRGLPVSALKQQEVKQYVNEELEQLQNEIQRSVPSSLRALHPAAGYRSLPVKIRELVSTYNAAAPTLVEFSNFSGHLVQHQFGDETRWAIRKLFNVGSASQLLSYIRHQGYRVPKMLADPSKDTTGKDELVKLAKETADPLLNLALNYRKFATMASRYVGGDWVPGPDGRVHGEFGWGPASAQLKCINPNLQQFPEHGPLAKRAKEMIVAEPGHTFVKIDMRGFHARMIGFLAEDKAYYKLADFDVHSYITAHYLRLPDAPYMLDMADDELRAYLKTIKRDHEHTRNFKVKRVVHGSQFGMGVNKLYNMHGPDLDPTVETAAELAGPKWFTWSDRQRADWVSQLGRREAQKLMNLMKELFPQTFVVFAAKIAAQIANETRYHLKSPFGHIRWFWDLDKEKSTAYLPSNCAHCHIQTGLLELDEMGALSRFEAVNFTHDALWYHCPEGLVSECLEQTQAVFERQSNVLFNSWGAFTCNSDAEIGPDLAHMN